MSNFCQRSYHRKCQRRMVEKSQTLVNVVCERPLNEPEIHRYQFCDNIDHFQKDIFRMTYCSHKLLVIEGANNNLHHVS